MQVALASFWVVQPPDLASPRRCNTTIRLQVTIKNSEQDLEGYRIYNEFLALMEAQMEVCHCFPIAISHREDTGVSSAGGHISGGVSR